MNASRRSSFPDAGRGCTKQDVRMHWQSRVERNVGFINPRENPCGTKEQIYNFL